MRALALTAVRRSLARPATPSLLLAKNSVLFRRNLASQYDYSKPYPPPPNGNQIPPEAPRSRFGWLASKALWGFLILAAIPLAYNEYWPHHTFPTSVAKLLRKGLWAESNKGEYDFQLALKYYIQALEEAQKLDLDHISDEYTGIQLKIAEMFERLSMYEEAFLIYSEILTLYLSVLTAKPDNPNYRPLTMEQKDHLIKKDLRLAVKIGSELENPNVMKPYIITHLLIANDQICRKLGHGINFGAAANYARHGGAEGWEKLSEPLIGKSPKSRPVHLVEKKENFLVVKCEDGALVEIEQNPDAWEPFCEEYFQAGDLCMLSLIMLQDMTTAFDTAWNLWEQMLLAGYGPPYKFLHHTCNIGSLAFNRAEQFEYGEIKLRKEIASKMGVEDYFGLTAEQIENSDKISRLDKDAFKEIIKVKEISIREAKSIYDLVLRAIKDHHQSEIDRVSDVINTDQTKEVQSAKFVAECSALATYGLGVINLHTGEYDEAERFLREARIKAKKIEYNVLIDNIEEELGKVFRERSEKSRK